MKMIIEIDLDNDDFVHECMLDCGLRFSPSAILTILDEIALEVVDIGFHSSGYSGIMDANGNTVGYLELV